eukprot:14139497-Ditylum_brightwellii.AAC.1
MYRQIQFKPHFMECKAKGRSHMGKVPSTVQRCTENTQKDQCTNSARRNEPGTNGQHDRRMHPTGHQPEGRKRSA